MKCNQKIKTLEEIKSQWRTTNLQQNQTWPNHALDQQMRCSQTYNRKSHKLGKRTSILKLLSIMQQNKTLYSESPQDFMSLIPHDDMVLTGNLLQSICGPSWPLPACPLDWQITKLDCLRNMPLQLRLKTLWDHYREGTVEACGLRLPRLGRRTEVLLSVWG